MAPFVIHSPWLYTMFRCVYVAAAVLATTLPAAVQARKPWPTTPQEAQSWRFDPIARVWSR